MELTVQTFLTLDGVMQAPGGPEEDPSGTFTHGGWQAPFPDPAVGQFVTELNSHASAFLFGRRTFDIFRGYWPDQTGPANPIATAINSLPKYVVSNSLTEAGATWRGEHPETARLVTGDVVAAVHALKDEPGNDAPDLLSTLASPGQAPHRAARRPSAPRTQPMLEKATKSNTTRRYERPGTVGSSSHRHRRARTRGSAPAERRINRTQALRSVPATRLAAGHARLGLHPVLPSPAQREAARCHDQHKLTQRMPGR
jgi:dihydrofolate reductase